MVIIGYIIVFISIGCFLLAGFYNLKRMYYEGIIGSKGLINRNYGGMVPKRVILEILNNSKDEIVINELNKALKFRKLYFICLICSLSLFLFSSFFFYF